MIDMVAEPRPDPELEEARPVAAMREDLMEVLKVPNRNGDDSISVVELGHVMANLKKKFGEIGILAMWTIVEPLEYRRYCIDREPEFAAWPDSCVESIGMCRSKEALAFIPILAVYHVGCIFAGLYECYRTRNLPSVMAEGKWAFTGFFSQLQVPTSLLRAVSSLAGFLRKDGAYAYF